MNPDERRMLERALKLSEENGAILLRLDRRARWAMLWGLLKLAIIIVPLIIGYLYLEPYFTKVADNYAGAKELIGRIDMPF